MYRVIFTQRALKDWKNLDKETQDRIAMKLKEFAKEPFRYARKLIHPKIGTYRFRIGDYRVIFDICIMSSKTVKIYNFKVTLFTPYALQSSIHFSTNFTNISL